MSRNGNNLGVSVAEAIESVPHKDQNTNTFYDPSNPVLAPAKEITPNKRRNWKRKIIGWSFFALLLVIGGFVLYALLKINHVDVKVLADNRRDSSKLEPDANKSENGLSAEAINIAREAMGNDPATTKPIASPSVSPGTSPDATYRFDYSATVNPAMGPATDFGTGTSSNQQPVGLAQPEARTLEHSLSEATLQSRANPTQSIFVDDAPNPLAALPKTSNIGLASSLEDKAASEERTKKSSTVLPPFGTMLPVRTQAVILTVRNNSFARLELTRDISGEGWSLPKGTIVIGHTNGSELQRAFVKVIGYLDPRENQFVKMTGEVVGADGGAGLQGKRIAVDRNRFKQTLTKVASTGLQMAGIMAGALTGRGGVVVNGAGYRLLNPVTDEAGQFLNGASGKRTFVKVEAGQPAYVMVADLPKEIRAVDAPGEDELARAATSLTDREVMELILFGTPEEIRAALPLMNEEQTGMVAKTVGIKDGRP